MASPQPARHELTARLVDLVTDPTWQRAHAEAVGDLPALREAIVHTIDAAIADDVPLGVALIVRAADALSQFNREHSRPEPVFDLARQGNLDGARRRIDVFSIDEHWRQTLLLAAAWLAPDGARGEARKLVEEVDVRFGSDRQIQDLLRWIRADLWGEPLPQFAAEVSESDADDSLIEQLLKRVGGSGYNRECIAARGLDADARDPDGPPPTPGLHRQDVEGGEEPTTRYLAELDEPYLTAYAAKDAIKGTAVLHRYLSVYTNYSYAEYRFSTLWLLLAYVVRFPRQDGGPWVQDSLVRILSAALSGGSVDGRRDDALKLPPWVHDDKSFAGLARLYQRHQMDFVRLTGRQDRYTTTMRWPCPTPALCRTSPRESRQRFSRRPLTRHCRLSAFTFSDGWYGVQY